MFLDDDGKVVSRALDDYVTQLSDDVLVLSTGKSRAWGVGSRKSKGSEKDRERQREIEMKMTALNALMNMNPEKALPLIKKLLASREEGSSALREQALFILAQYDDEEAEQVLIEVLKNDPDPEIQARAVFWLGQSESEEGLNAIVEIALKSDDESLRENAVFALSQHDSDRAADLLKGIARDKKSSDQIRGKAIFWLGQRDDEGAMEFLRDLYAELEEEDVKEQVLFAVAQNGDEDESLDWLVTIAKDKGESMRLRTRAIFWAGQMGELPVDALGSLYEDLEDREMKEQIVFALSQQDSDGAITLLMEIARKETDVELKTNIIFWIGQSDDPRSAEFLEEIIMN